MSGIYPPTTFCPHSFHLSAVCMLISFISYHRCAQHASFIISAGKQMRLENTRLFVGEM